MLGSAVFDFLFRTQLLGLSDPAFHPSRQSDFFADLVCGLGSEPGDLPIMEDAQVIKSFFDGRRDMGELLEIVSDATRTGQDFESRGFGGPGLVVRRVIPERDRHAGLQ